MKRKQNSAEKVKRKLTVWQYQYDNGEAGMLHERKGVWRGEKRIWSDIAYFPNENEAQKHVKDLCRKSGVSEKSACGIVEPIRINGKILARAWQSDGWDAAGVQGLIRDFLLWMTADLFGEGRKGVCSKEMALKDACDRANQRISENDQKRGTPKHKGLQRLWLETQMMVLRELESYLFDLGFWTREEGRNTLNGWLHALLPAVYSPPVDNLPVDDPKHLLNYEADSQMLFKNLLTAMVTPENCKHFMAVPVKGEFPMKKADGTDIWGYVRGFQVTGKNGHRYRVPTLQIRKDVLTEVAATLMPIECDWLTVIKTVREQQPDYLVGKSRNVRLSVDGKSKLCATLVLSVDKLSWLPKAAQNILLELTMLIAPQK